MKRSLGFSFLTILPVVILCHAQLVSSYKEDISHDGHQNATSYYPNQQERLPKDIIPEKYQLWIKPKTDGKLDFCGNVTIDLKCVNSTKYIILHSKKLNITTYGLYKLDSSSQPVHVSMKTNLTYEQIMFKTKQNLVSGNKYRLSMTFRGLMTVHTHDTVKSGFYTKSYIKKNGKKSNFVFTFLGFENVRGLFPCFDEPEFKAKFQITIAHDKNLSAVAGTPLLKKVPLSGFMVESTFQSTVLMSTYLLTFAVTDFANISTTTSRGTKIRIWVKENSVEKVRSALAPAASFLSFYENYTGVNYPYSELNYLAVDMIFGGFEGLGLIIQKERTLYWNTTDEEEIDGIHKRQVLPHEMAHMWFGDMVTIKYWDEAWLYQGAADFFRQYALENYNKKWAADKIAYLSVGSALYWENNEKSTIPLNPTRKTGIEDVGTHDFILYFKGAAMLHMLRKLLGEKDFQQGIRSYVKKYKYRNAQATDLWKEFQLTGPSFDVKTVMHDWEYQSGYPLIDIKYVGNDINGRKIYTASQSRYDSNNDPTDPKNLRKGFTWYVPLWYTESCSPQKTNLIWMNKTSVNFTVRSSVKWIKANTGGAGTYRVNYEQEMWERLAKQLNFYPKVFDDGGRYALIHDALQLWKTKRLNITIPLKLTAYISKERSYMSFKKAVNGLHEEIGIKLTFRPLLIGKYKKYMISLLKESMLKNTWDDPAFQRNLLSQAFKTLAFYGEPTTIKKSLGIINHWMKTGKHINKLFYTRQAVYETAIRYGNDTHWEFLHEQYKNISGENEPETYERHNERNKLIAGLSATQSIKTIYKWLNESIETTSNKTYIWNKLTELSRFSPGREEAWTYYKTNYDKVVERDASVNGNNTKSFLGFTEHFDEESQLQEVEQFARSKEKLWSLPATNASLKVIRSNIKWFKRNEQLIDDFVTEQVA